jgi:hypothetical protein
MIDVINHTYLFGCLAWWVQTYVLTILFNTRVTFVSNIGLFECVVIVEDEAIYTAKVTSSVLL